MGTPGMRTNLKLEGEKEYRAAISEINSALKVLGSEMKLTKERFSEQAGSMEALSAEHDVLERQYLTQKEKVDALRGAVDLAAKTYGEASTKTNNYKSSLNTAETELLKMEKALRDTETAMEGANKETDKASASLEQFGDSAKAPIKSIVQLGTESQETGKSVSSIKDKFSSVLGESKGLGSAINDLGGKFGVSLPDGITKGLDGLGKVNPAALTAAGGIAALVAAVVKVEQALMDMTSEAADWADDILMFSDQIGMSTDEVQEWAYASELLDVSFDTVKGSIKDLTSNMKSYQDAMAEGAINDQTKAFQELGISIYDTNGSLRDANDVFMDAVDALGQVQNTTERDALAMSVLGESAQELNPLIAEGTEAFRQYAEDAHEAGYVLSTDALESLQAVDDAQQELLATQKSVTNQIAGEYAPYMAEALGDTKDFIDDIGEALTKSKVVESFGSILTSASGLLEPVGELAGFLMPALSKSLERVAYLFALIADTANVLVGLLTLNGDMIKTGLGLNMSSGKLSNTQKLYYKDALDYTTYDPNTGMWVGNAANGYMEAGTGRYVYNASGTDNFLGGFTWVGENGPELLWLPQGSRIDNAQESRMYGGDTFYITINANKIKELNDLIRMANDARRMQRMGG